MEHALLFAANPNPMWVYDEGSLRFLMVNEAAVRHYGYSREEFMTMTLKDIRPPEEVPALLKAIKDQGGVIVAPVGVWRHRKKDGTLIEVEVVVSCITFAGRQARLVLVHDITERLAMEKALRQTHERLRFLLSSNPAVIYACSPRPPYPATFVSENVNRQLGYEPRQFTDDPDFWASRIHPEDKQHVFAHLVHLFETGELIQRYRFLDNKGQYRWMRDDARVMCDHNGAPREILGCWFDITERRQAEEALKQQADLLDLANDAIFVRSMDDRTTFWNRGAEKLYGWKADEAIGQVTHELLRTVFPKPVRKILSRLPESGHWEGELVHTTKSGATVMVASRWSLQLDKQGAPGGILEINTDVTDRRRAETALRVAQQELEIRVRERTRELELANQALAESQKELLYISEREQRRIGQDLHDDLGQQLVGIEFLSNALREKLKTHPEAARAKEIGRLIRAAINHARQLAQGIWPVTSEPEGLRQALKALAARTSEVFHIRCSFVSPEPVLFGDPAEGSHLYRIAQEAVTNSIKHGKANAIAIELGTTDGRVVLRVTDNGKGFSEPRPKGRGMGWQIMQYRASTLGGTIDLQNGPKGGAVLTCHVPLIEKGIISNNK